MGHDLDRAALLLCHLGLTHSAEALPVLINVKGVEREVMIVLAHKQVKLRVFISKYLRQRPGLVCGCAQPAQLKLETVAG